MRRLVAVTAAVALLATGCTFSKINPNATVTITGRALDASGHPLAGVKVQLFKEADIGEALVGAVLAVGTLGSACLLPNAPAVCHQAHVATTDADGGYTFQIKGSDTQGLIGTASTLDLVVADPRSGADGPSTTVSFTVTSTSVSLPAARLWNGSPQVGERGGDITLGWSGLPAGTGSSPSFSAQVFARTQQEPLWSQPASGHTATVDARVLEDHAGTIAAGARTTVAGGSGTGTVHAAYLSARRAVNPVSGPPPSRGRPCSAVTGTGAPAATVQAHCAVTDGDFFTPARLVAGAGRVVTGVVIDLGTVRPVNLVVTRGVEGMFVVEISTDGVHYREVAIGNGSPAELTSPGAPSARYVRVRSPGGLDESLMAQVSVW